MDIDTHIISEETIITDGKGATKTIDTDGNDKTKDIFCTYANVVTNSSMIRSVSFIWPKNTPLTESLKQQGVTLLFPSRRLLFDLPAVISDENEELAEYISKHIYGGDDSDSEFQNPDELPRSFYYQ